ncbi:MAG: TatD family hydrolase, partial [Bacillota bacterium]
AALAGNFEFIFAAVGIHPHEADMYDPEVAQQLRGLAQQEKVVAIGEIGLDYHYDNSPRDLQRQAFRAQLRLAASLELPVIIHSREAEADTLKIISEERGADFGGVVHCYSSSAEMAAELIDMGFYLGFTGLITFKNLDWLRDIVTTTPIGKIVAETDSPYMAPEPYRGRRNEPAHVRKVVDTIASCHDITPEQAARRTTLNGLRLFQIDNLL